MKRCSLKREMKLGKKIEMEHAHNFPKNLQHNIAERIAKDHIKESKCYYSKGLLPMERRLNKYKNAK